MTSTAPNAILVRAGRTGWIFGVAIAVGVLLLPACRKKDTHANSATAAAHTDEHGHDHADGPHTDEVRLTPEAVEHYGVKVAEARLWALRPTIVAPARVAFNAEAMAHVGSPLRGRAARIDAKLGEEVTRGQTLVVVESPELGQAQADFLQKRAAAQAAGPQVDLTKAAWDRAKTLMEKSQGMSLTDVQKREAEHKAAVAAQKSAEAGATAAENALHLLGMDQEAVEALARSGEIAPRYSIRAPISGRVVQREVTLGELVGPDRDSILVLADTSALWVLADLPEARLPTVAVGAKAWVSVGSIGSDRHEGHVSFIAALVEPTTRTAQVRIELPASARSGAAGSAVRPGMFAEVEIVGSSSERAESTPRVAVPDEAVQTVEGGPAVFVPIEGEPNTFRRQPIRVGPSVGGLIPVLAGLVEGEKYVVAGSFILKAELGKGSAAHEH